MPQRSLSSDAPSDDGVRVLDALRRLVGALRSTNRAAVRDAGVTGAQLFVLQQLAAHPNQSVSDLATATRTRQNSVSDVISRLVKRGLIARNVAEDDARRAVLSLTRAGAGVVRSSPVTTQASLVGAFNALPKSRQQVLSASLEAWVSAAGLMELPATMFFERAARARRAVKRARTTRSPR